MKTRITAMFGTKYPIMQGGMMWVGRAELAAAVSNAGGLGTITALTQPTPEALVNEIERCRNMTDKPFAVNLTIFPSINEPPYGEYVAAAIEGKVPVLETAGRSPEAYMPALKKAGVKVVHKCTSIRHALTAQRIGCDAVSIDGFECAGHPGEDDVTNLILLPIAANKLSIPFIASGGIANGRQMAAALALGAEGINMGTRFVATKEAPVHENMKDAIVAADERQTTLLFRTLKNTARVFKNAISEQVVSIEALPGDTNFKDIQPLVAGVRGKENCVDKGEVDNGIWTAGMVMGLIDDIPSCSELIENIVNECNQVIMDRLASLAE